MDLTIVPRRLAGSVAVPTSKSLAHRAILCAALAAGVSPIRPLALSEDLEATLRCVHALGAEYALDGDCLTVTGRAVPYENLPLLDCGESGSTLRFLIPLALALTGGAQFTGRGRLMDRPLEPYREAMPLVRWTKSGEMLTLEGRLVPGEYALPGNVSSQFFTGLLLALPLLEGPSVLRSTTALESRSYVLMTLRTLEAFGVHCEETSPGEFFIPGGQNYRSAPFTVGCDHSQAAFWRAANGLGSRIALPNLRPDPLQPDSGAVDRMEALVGSGEPVRTLDLSPSPDAAPPLAAWAALAPGITRFTGCRRLRLKESDRLAAICEVLSALGADIHIEGDDLVLRGRPQGLPGGVSVDSWGDHRIAMMAAVAATRCREPVTVRNAGCVSKSYPHFWDDYRLLGGEIHEYTGQ